MSDDLDGSNPAVDATTTLKRINRTADKVEATASEVATNATNAASKSNEASTSAHEAASHAANAKANATEASNSANTANAKETEATTSATNAQNSANAASTSAVESKAKESEIKTHAANAQASATEAASSAKTAKNKEAEASSYATKAQTSATDASNSATTAKNKADDATASAQIAKDKEAEATSSAITSKEKETESIASAEAAKEKEVESVNSAKIALTKETEASTSAKEAKRSAAEAAVAHNLSTTAGLAGAFNVKADEALKRMFYAGIALFVALALVGIFGYSRFDEAFSTISDLIEKDKVLEAIVAQILFFIMGVGAPVWLAWMATRMMSKYFQLSEDYSYKASLAKAYIGFKEQADGLDPIFEERLFAAAITQLDANPLRFFEESSHPGSPIQDLLQQPFMIAALKKDGFRSSISQWMNDRFKTSFYVDRTDILDVIPKDLKDAADKMSESIKDVQGKVD